MVYEQRMRKAFLSSQPIEKRAYGKRNSPESGNQIPLAETPLIRIRGTADALRQEQI